ncbi:hypothetical protein XELAEV_18036489mg [Xenopus laevis]|uniref:Uncharacterized protein n=1 Tax=Xenopus laevis TaxID=8355 RepID=A0A974CIG5_XENLA|nr:hypothetical protein XELAEV_18036489mg [Xenopus laevis]
MIEPEGSFRLVHKIFPYLHSSPPYSGRAIVDGGPPQIWPGTGYRHGAVFYRNTINPYLMKCCPQTPGSKLSLTPG